ncbi:hypothetical protein Ciccas_006422 [Cichlidogyrus casuarinus]|uniref:Uncharacterized protein n=1 Tax=Cichlidogyrus casuarinus TaxID=1844966 RepID=A0ABD2Q6Z1_9PLAT
MHNKTTEQFAQLLHLSLSAEQTYEMFAAVCDHEKVTLTNLGTYFRICGMRQRYVSEKINTFLLNNNVQMTPNNEIKNLVRIPDVEEKHCVWTLMREAYKMEEAILNNWQMLAKIAKQGEDFITFKACSAHMGHQIAMVTSMENQCNLFQNMIEKEDMEGFPYIFDQRVVKAIVGEMYQTCTKHNINQVPYDEYSNEKWVCPFAAIHGSVTEKRW